MKNEHIEDQTNDSRLPARQGEHIDVNPEVLKNMKDGDVLILKPGVRIGVFSWPDLEDTMKSDGEITAAQLLIARETNIVLPHTTAVKLAQHPRHEWLKLARAVKTMYALYKQGRDVFPPALVGSELDPNMQH